MNSIQDFNHNFYNFTVQQPKWPFDFTANTWIQGFIGEI
jgi:hypothetical protein